jgi:hypothetical protein
MEQQLPQPLILLLHHAHLLECPVLPVVVPNRRLVLLLPCIAPLLVGWPTTPSPSPSPRTALSIPVTTILSIVTILLSPFPGRGGPAGGGTCTLVATRAQAMNLLQLHGCDIPSAKDLPSRQLCPMLMLTHFRNHGVETRQDKYCSISYLGSHLSCSHCPLSILIACHLHRTLLGVVINTTIQHPVLDWLALAFPYSGSSTTTGASTRPSTFASSSCSWCSTPCSRCGCRCCCRRRCCR